jgi:hypothetical protein
LYSGPRLSDAIKSDRPGFSAMPTFGIKVKREKIIGNIGKEGIFLIFIGTFL